MKEYLVVVTFEHNWLMVFDYDTKKEAGVAYLMFQADGFEIGEPEKMYVGPNMNYICPVCDGGPGNFCCCSCPK